MTRQNTYVLAVIVLLLLAACDAAGPAPFEAQYVVESYQTAGELLQPVRLSRTAPLAATYDISEQAVSGAQVTIELLKADGSVANSYPFYEDPDSAGYYRPRADAQFTRVQPLRTYRLDVAIPGEGGQAAGALRATTTVPDTFSIVRATAREAVYQQDEVALTVTRSRSPGRSQGFYVFTIEALDPRREALTPLYRDLLGESVDDLDLAELFRTSSPVLNEANYETNPDSTLTVRLPWLAVAFYGPNRLRIHVLDDNLYDFLRSQRAQQGGGTLAPGEIPNVIEHVEGGTGIFGSFARQDYGIVVHPPGS